MDNKQARYLHRMLDRLAEGQTLKPQDIEALRKNLPELPKKKTLEEIAWDMDSAWAETSGNDWKAELFGDLETWLSEQHNQLRAHLEGVKSQAHPALPDGMRIAEHNTYGRCVVSQKVDDDGDYLAFIACDQCETKCDHQWVDPDDLTFISAKPAPPTLPAGTQLADHDELGRVVVSPRPNQTFHTEVLFADNSTVTGVAHAYVGADTLTPVGSKPAHPEFLGTEADYHYAPAGTVAGKDGWLVWIKQKNGDWSCDGGSEEASVLAQTGKRRVLRWGWSE